MSGLETKERRRKYPEKGIYIPRGFEPTMDKLEELLRRESLSLSEWFRREADRYVSEHSPGNPQLPIWAYSDEKPKPPLCPDRMNCWKPTSWPDCKKRKTYRCFFEGHVIFG